MSRLVLDTGSLIAFERADRAVVALFARARELGMRFVVPAGVIGQVWRDGRRQARLARFLAASSVDVEPLDDPNARAAGQLCGVTRTRDVIDASVVLSAKKYSCAIVTSDARDLRRLDASTKLIRA